LFQNLHVLIDPAPPTVLRPPPPPNTDPCCCRPLPNGDEVPPGALNAVGCGVAPKGDAAAAAPNADGEAAEGPKGDAEGAPKAFAGFPKALVILPNAPLPP